MGENQVVRINISWPFCTRIRKAQVRQNKSYFSPFDCNKKLIILQSGLTVIDEQTAV